MGNIHKINNSINRVSLLKDVFTPGFMDVVGQAGMEYAFNRGLRAATLCREVRDLCISAPGIKELYN